MEHITLTHTIGTHQNTNTISARDYGSGVLWSYLKHTRRYLATEGCGAISNTLDGTWHQCAMEPSQTHYMALWGTVELQIYTGCQGTMANGAMKLFRWHLAPVLWSSLKHIAFDTLGNYGTTDIH